MSASYDDMYADRRLTDGVPDLESRALAARDVAEQRAAVDATDVDKVLRHVSRLVDISGRRRIAVIGCGHRPKMLRALLDLGHDAMGIEPVDAYVRAASEYLEREGLVLKGVAEHLPLADGSQHVVLFENVLEHVDSVSKALAELYRVTAPGGVAYVKTNSRLRFSPSGHNPEFRVPFYNWLPPIVKECYVHHHLHFDPSLAEFTTRPAVHWFDFAQLCQLGREAGFARFYSLLDVIQVDDPEIRGRWTRRVIARLCKHSPWLRALALTQVGGFVFMYKRLT